MVTRTWKVYGIEGHRQKHSFCPSYIHDFSNDWWAIGKTRILKVDNFDITGTHDYSVVHVTRDTAKECEQEFWGQIDDGIFENCNVGRVEEIK